MISNFHTTNIYSPSFELDLIPIKYYFCVQYSQTSKQMSQDNFNYSVSIDCVIFGYDTTDLKVLLIKRGEDPYCNYWALPGDLIKPKEDIDDSVSRVLKDLTGLSQKQKIETY